MSQYPSGEEARPDRGAGAPPSQQVSWFEVYAFAERLAARQGVDLDHQLIAGTPRWCGMPDTDARKLMAVVLGGVREALNNDVDQEHRAAASREISHSADWSAVAQRVRNGRGDNYIPRKDVA